MKNKTKREKLTKVSLDVVYEAELIQKISAVMSRCDLGIESIHHPISEKYSWKTTTKVDVNYIKNITREIRTLLESSGYRVISIKQTK